MQNLLIVVYCVAGLVMIGSMWKVYQKAGQPGWSAIVPIYNAYVWLKIAEKPGWWLILMCIPGVNIVCDVMVSMALAERYGKSTAYGVGLAFLPFIYYPALGFGGAQYQTKATYAKAA